jgi:hypothetical protein
MSTRVDRCRAHPDPHLPGAGLRHRDVGYLDDIRAAIAADDDRFHVISLVHVICLAKAISLVHVISHGKLRRARAARAQR